MKVSYSKILVGMMLFMAMASLASASSSIPINDHALWSSRNVPQPLTMTNTTSTGLLFMNLTSTYNNDVQPTTYSWVSGVSTQPVSFITVDTRVYFRSLEQVSQNNLNLTLLVCNSLGTCNPYQIDSVPTNLGACASIITAMIGNNQTYAVSVPAGGDGSWRAIVNFSHDRSCSGQAANRYQQMFNVSAAYISTAGGAFVSDIVPQAGISTVNITVPALNGLNLSSVVGQTLNGTAGVATTGTAKNATACWYNGVTGSLIGCNFTTYVPNNKTNFSLPNLGDGRFNVSLQMCGEGSSAAACIYAPFNRTYNVDGTPFNLNITYPRGVVFYHLANSNISINWTAIDANPGTCVLSYNNVNYTVGCFTNTSSVNVTRYESRNASIYGNDSMGNANINISTWDYRIFQWQRGINSQTTEGNIEHFQTNISSAFTGFLSQAYLVYNGTAYSATISSTSSSNLTISRNVQIPEVVSNQVKNVYWSFVFSDGVVVNSSVVQQTIQALSIDDCSALTFVLLNMTVYDEDTQVKLNATGQNTTIEIALNITSTDGAVGVLNFSKAFNRTNPAAICISSGALTSSSYSMSALIRYEARDYVSEFYNIQNLTLNLSSVPQNISLYDLAITSSQEFLITFKGADFLPLSNAIILIQRKYIGEDQFKTVEAPVTDKQGQVIGHLVLSSVIYSMSVMKNGQLIAFFDNIQAFCANQATGDCRVSLNAFDTGIPTDDFATVDNVVLYPSLNKTARNFDLLFSTVDGSVVTMGVNITNSDGYQNSTICSTSLVSSAGSLSCNIPIVAGNQTFIVTIIKDGEVIARTAFDLSQSAKDQFGNNRMLLVLLMYGTLAFMFPGNPYLMLLGAIGGIAFGGILFLLDGVGLFTVGNSLIWFVVACVLAIWRISRT